MRENGKHSSIAFFSRLINAQSTNATNSQQNYQYQYGYDGANNRTVLRDILQGTTESYAYHGSNSQLLTKVTKNGQSEDFTYNTAGAITRRTKNGVITNYSYDGAGRLIEVKVGSTIIAKYLYDPYGRLVKTTEGSTTTVRLPRGNETAYEKVTEQGMPTVERKYIIALGKYIARDERIAGVTTRVFYHGDHLGSTRALSGEDSGSFTYDPFGNIVSATGDAEDHNHRFTGKPMDGTGLYYYGARFYDPTLGRFINMDPAKDGGNWWVYVNNNPLRYVDPTGLNAEYAELVLLGGWIGVGIYVTYDIVTDGSIMQTIKSGAIWLGETFSSGWNRMFNRADSKDGAEQPSIPCPGTDAEKAPGEDWEWKSGNPNSNPGDKDGNWVNRKTGDSLHPDLKHDEPIGPHWDYKNKESGTWWRIFPDGRSEPK